ncbi:MAG: epoxyqueuosine reductase QueH [Elusimicrobiota bacterium]|jgi:predicted adenine nucleotide alpha hydrolase (AANH) superfamily ATPase|nr:epoxyqueuosine reductase QueH [Elusimicrobiota bacterium]
MKKLLLHICCAPCGASVLKALKDDFKISFFWNNPNIYNLNEYNNRKDSAKRYAQELGVEFFQLDNFEYDYQLWKNQSNEICSNCYQLRLKEAAAFAKNKGFDFFSTSLLSSPYQKHNIIKDICAELASNLSVEFLYRDFREFFYAGKNEMREKGYYLQKYCACEKSYFERFHRGEKK